MHKYIRTVSCITHRSAVFSLFAVIFTILVLLTACGENNNTAVPDSNQLLKQAQDAMKRVNSYHFNLTSDNLAATQGFEIQTADGDVLAPDKLQAKGSVSLEGFTVSQVSFIAIGQQDYYTDPFTGKWTPRRGLVDPHTLADPQAGIGVLLSNIQQPSAATSSSVDGHDCWSITGQVSAKYLAGIIGDSAANNGNVKTTVCIGKSDSRPYQIQFNGIVIAGDSAQTARTIKLSKFNETITIQAPQV